MLKKCLAYLWWWLRHFGLWLIILMLCRQIVLWTLDRYLPWKDQEGHLDAAIIGWLAATVTWRGLKIKYLDKMLKGYDRELRKTRGQNYS